LEIKSKQYLLFLLWLDNYHPPPEEPPNPPPEEPPPPKEPPPPDEKLPPPPLLPEGAGGVGREIDDILLFILE
jgi:hypothetical protein